MKGWQTTAQEDRPLGCQLQQQDMPPGGQTCRWASLQEGITWKAAAMPLGDGIKCKTCHGDPRMILHAH